jgi:Predicted carbamoyl transferase, NodU family
VNILGMNGSRTIKQHDPSAALVCDGKVMAACEEERYGRIKSGRGLLPIESIRACLTKARLSIRDIDMVYYPADTYPEMAERIRAYLQHYFGYAPPIRMINHQVAHLASAFFCSDFQEAMCLSYDAYGDSLSASLARASRKNGIEVLQTFEWDDSLGLFYSLMTSYLGFQVTEDEYKVMGLAAYGKPGIDLSAILHPTSDGYSFNKAYMREDIWHLSPLEPYYHTALQDLLGLARQPGEPITQHHKDVAYAAQCTLEACACALVKQLHRRTGLSSLCLAGGVALNCSANMVLQRLSCVEQCFVQPAASDRGLALGSAVYGAFEQGDHPEPLSHVYLGSDYDTSVISHAIRLTGVAATRPNDLVSTVAQLLADEKIVGFYTGRSEFGPRALGHRSILADPRQAKMKDTVNARIKFREEFRPFAPSVLEERCADLFEMNHPSPYMTTAVPVRQHWQEKLGAVTHVNGTARVQTVNAGVAPQFYQVIAEFAKLTGVPALLNTSFNIKGQPIVETPLDALATFASTGMDALILGDYLIVKPDAVRKTRVVW